MKQSRRHELKTNELSVFLQQAYDSLLRNLNYVIGGVLAVAVLLTLVLYVQHKRERSREQAWQDLMAVQGASVTSDASALDKARDLAQKQQGNGELGALSALTVADIAERQALNLDPAKEADKRLKLLREARDQYKAVADQYADRPAIVARARLGLAKVEESLFVAGEGTVQNVRAQYEALAKDPKGLYGGYAAEQLKTLDERLRPLKVVTTRPAELPAILPAAEVVGTRPAVVTTAPATTAPAK